MTEGCNGTGFAARFGLGVSEVIPHAGANVR